MSDPTLDYTPEPPYEEPTVPDPSFDPTTIVTTDSYTGTTIVESDTDGDGYIDSISADLDGDGFLESASHDTDGDGYIDVDVIVDPASGSSITVMDADGDGVADAVLIDADGDAYADQVFADSAVFAEEASDDDPLVESPDGPGLDVSDASDPSLFVPADDLPEGEQDGVHGDPRADIVYHQVQPGPVDCLPTSVAMVISEATGTDVPADDLVAMANELGFMGSSGMDLDDSLALLESYGVEATIETGDADTLRVALDAGDEVIVALDSADLYADGGGPFDTGMQSGHAVVLTGIDDGPPAYVYINDPAFNDGSGVQVPLEQFMDSWEDADLSYVSIPVGEETAETEPATEDVVQPAVASDASGEATDADGADSANAAAAGQTAEDQETEEDSVLKRILLLPITLLHDFTGDLLDK